MNIVVYCSSRDSIATLYKETATGLGQWIGANGATLVYGGINRGLMRIVADSTRLNGGKAVGVVPVEKKANEYPFNDETILAVDLNDRKSKMIELGDVFVVLAGGYGTLDELFATFAFLSFTGDEAKTIIIVNDNNLFNATLQQLTVMADNHLFDPRLMSRILVAQSVGQCCEMLDNLKEKYQ